MSTFKVFFPVQLMSNKVQRDNFAKTKSMAMVLLDFCPCPFLVPMMLPSASKIHVREVFIDICLLEFWDCQKLQKFVGLGAHSLKIYK